MILVTRKSECKKIAKTLLVKSPKEAIRRTLSNYLIKDGFIIKAYQPSYVSRDELVLSDLNNSKKISVKLVSTLPLVNINN